LCSRPWEHRMLHGRGDHTELRGSRVPDHGPARPTESGRSPANAKTSTLGGYRSRPYGKNDGSRRRESEASNAVTPPVTSGENIRPCPGSLQDGQAYRIAPLSIEC